MACTRFRGGPLRKWINLSRTAHLCMGFDRTVQLEYTFYLKLFRGFMEKAPGPKQAPLQRPKTSEPPSPLPTDGLAGVGGTKLPHFERVGMRFSQPPPYIDSLELYGYKFVKRDMEAEIARMKRNFHLTVDVIVKEVERAHAKS